MSSRTLNNSPTNSPESCQKNNPEQLQQASIQWDEDNQPVSSSFGDVYFSRASGIKETRYVFMAQNELPDRWSTPGNIFTIGETGFGTGLNFLVAAQTWLASTTSSTLHFVSAEKYPLSQADLQQALSLWPQLSDGSSELIDELKQQYPPAVTGIHRLKLANDRIVLTLMYGDATRMFSSLRGSDHPLFQQQGNPIFDAWFLDGFAPAKNPEMWTEDLFQTIADLSQPGTTFSTFTAAGIVRRGLANAGFEVEKIPGFGHKREMLRGKTPRNEHKKSENNKNENKEKASTTSEKDWQPASFNSPHQPPWYLSATNINNVKNAVTSAIVIGGGIAGCSTARALAERGIAVSLLERHDRVGQEASGNSQGILYPKLSVADSTLSRFGLMALLNASRYYSALLDQPGLGQRCGVIVLPQAEKNRAEFEQIAQRFPQELVQFLCDRQLREKAGVPLSNSFGLFFPQLGWITPPAACERLSDHPLITIKKADIHEIECIDNQWHAIDHRGLMVDSSDVLVICCGFDSARFSQASHLPLKKIRGQITNLPATDKSAALKTVLCGEGYIAPSNHGIHTLGATYNFDDDSTDIRLEDHRVNLNQLAATDPLMADAFKDVAATDSQATLTGRAAFRCTTPDYLPIAGPAPKLDRYLESYQLLRKNARSHIPIAGEDWPGLFLNIGHGSRGLSYAPLCAEMLASQIDHDAPPLELALRRAIHPGRFIIRDLKRNKR